MCRIAEVLIKLQQVGNVHYIGWRMDFGCQQPLIEDLQGQAKDMEDELERWNKEVTLARKRFYELNYYTTRQLLVLRGELGRLKVPGQSSKSQQWGQVMALLESISSAVTLPVLAKIVQDIAKQPLKELTEDKHSPTPPSESVQIVRVEDPMAAVSVPPLPSVNEIASRGEPSARALQRQPRAGLTQEDLTAEQQRYFTDIVEQFEYCKMTALKAIEAVEEGDWNDIVNWLKENADECEEAFQEAAEGDESEQEPEESEAEDDEEMESGSDSEGPSEIESTLSMFSNF